MEEINTRQDEEKLVQKVRSKKRIRGLLIVVNVILGSYLCFSIVQKILDFASSNVSDTEIIPIDGNSIDHSKELYDKYIAKNGNDYITADVYDFGIYGGYLSLSKPMISEGFYNSFDYISLINVSSKVIESKDINREINRSFLNGGINLTSLDVGDYLALYERITESNINSQHKAIKIRSEKGIEKSIYSLPDSNNKRKKITIKSKDSSPCLVISVKEINSLPDDYYDYVIVGSNEQIEKYKNNNDLSSYKINYVSSLLDAFKTKANYCIYLSNEEKMIVSNYISSNNKDVINIKDASLDESNLYNSYIKELGGYLTNAGSCDSSDSNSFIVKPYLEEYEIGKYVVICNENIKISTINDLYNEKAN